MRFEIVAKYINVCSYIIIWDTVRFHLKGQKYNDLKASNSCLGFLGFQLGLINVAVFCYYYYHVYTSVYALI